MTLSTSPYADIPGMQAAGVNDAGVDVVLPFAPEEYEQRLATTRASLAAQGLDAVVLTAPDSIYYLTNYQTPGNPFTVLVVARDSTRIFTRELEGTNVKYRSLTPFSVYEEGQAPEPLVVAHLARICPASAARIGYEGTSPRLTVASQRELESLYPAKWVDASALVLEQRTVKSEAEVGSSAARARAPCSTAPAPPPAPRAAPRRPRASTLPPPRPSRRRSRARVARPSSSYRDTRQA